MKKFVKSASLNNCNCNCRPSSSRQGDSKTESCNCIFTPCCDPSNYSRVKCETCGVVKELQFIRYRNKNAMPEKWYCDDCDDKNEQQFLKSLFNDTPCSSDDGNSTENSGNKVDTEEKKSAPLPQINFIENARNLSLPLRFLTSKTKEKPLDNKSIHLQILDMYVDLLPAVLILHTQVYRRIHDTPLLEEAMASVRLQQAKTPFTPKSNLKRDKGWSKTPRNYSTIHDSQKEENGLRLFDKDKLNVMGAMMSNMEQLPALNFTNLRHSSSNNLRFTTTDKRILKKMEKMKILSENYEQYYFKLICLNAYIYQLFLWSEYIIRTVCFVTYVIQIFAKNTETFNKGFCNNCRNRIKAILERFESSDVKQLAESLPEIPFHDETETNPVRRIKQLFNTNETSAKLNDFRKYLDHAILVLQNYCLELRIQSRLLEKFWNRCSAIIPELLFHAAQLILKSKILDKDIPEIRSLFPEDEPTEKFIQELKMWCESWIGTDDSWEPKFVPENEDQTILSLSVEEIFSVLEGMVVKEISQILGMSIPQESEDEKLKEREAEKEKRVEILSDISGQQKIEKAEDEFEDEQENEDKVEVVEILEIEVFPDDEICDSTDYEEVD